MGAFFTSVQARVAGDSAETVRTCVVAAVREWVLSNQYADAVPAGDAADRTIFIGPAGDRPWVAVYDQLTDEQDLDLLTELARVVSEKTGGATIGILVHDSDVLELRLCRAGKLEDSYCNDPDYFEKATRKRRAELAGRADRWRDLLVPGATPKDLEAAWKGDVTSAEETLESVARLIGLDAQLARNGYRYLSEQPHEGFVRLAFRSSAPRPHETPAQGPSRFAYASGGGRIECCVGDPIDHLSTSVRNEGGPSRGLEIVLHGEAIAKGLVEPTQVTIRVGSTSVEATVPLATPERQHQRVVRFEAIDIPGGMVTEHAFSPELLERLQALGPKPSAEKLHSVLGRLFTPLTPTETTVYVNVAGHAAVAGKGTLLISVVPLPHTPGAATSPPAILDVMPPLRRPLRSTERAPYISVRLKALTTPRTLQAWVALGAERTTCATVAGDVIERWHATLNPASRVSYDIVLSPTLHSGPKGSSLPAREIPTGDPWKALRRALETCEYLAGHLRRQVRLDPMKIHPGDGFFFDVGSVFFQHGHEKVVPYLGLWVTLDDQDHEQTSALATVLTRLVDEAVQRADGLQAFMARWAFQRDNAEATIYEETCGISGQCTTGRRWSGRYLRAVSEDLWLGPDLLAALGDLGPLEHIAVLKPAGRAIRVTLKPHADLGALERALALLLPDREDWQRGVDDLYPNRRVSP